MSFQSELVGIITQIDNHEMAYSNTIVIGDNASGKSELLKKYVNKRLYDGQSVYYIDAVNRGFHVSKVNDSWLEPISFRQTITKHRLLDENFNVSDTWAYFGTATECIEQIYPVFETEVQTLLQEFFGTTFSIAMKETNEVTYNFEETGKLSSGYQAVIRLFLELLYYQKTKAAQAETVVVIDEIDEYLSPKTAARIFPFLMKHFSDMSYVCSTHSADLLATAKDSNVLIISGGNIEVLDSNDFNDVDDVSAVFKEVFAADREEGELETDEKLRLLLNNRMSGKWGEIEERMFASIQENDLSKAKKMIYKEIKEW